MVGGNFVVRSSFEFDLAYKSLNFWGLDLMRSFALNADKGGGVDIKAIFGTTVGG